MKFRKRIADEQLDRELRFHIENLISENIAAGFSAEEARRRAMLEFGGKEQIKEELRDVRRFPLWDGTVSNLTSALRFIRKSPSFSITVILTLALGIGANSAVFSALDAILLRPLPFPEASRLMTLHEYFPKQKSPESPIAPVRLEEWNSLNSTFQAITGYYTEDISEASGALPEKLTNAWVAPRFFQTLGVSPALGRDFSMSEEHAGGPPAVVISYRLWQRRFHGDPHAIGRTLRLYGNSEPIIGIMPASFGFPDHDVDLWAPVPPDSTFAQRRDATWYWGIGRLKPGVTPAQARANLATVQSRLGREYPKTDADLTVEIQPLKETTVGGVRRSLWMLFGAVSLLLLIACTNIAGLLLARTTERSREISIRFALGASRRKVIAQLLTEVFVLAILGSSLGLLVAAAASRVFVVLAKNLPRVEEVGLDWRLALYTFACALIATLLCGLFPAVHATRHSISGALAGTSRSQVSTRNPLQWLLVATQVALAVTLLIGAGLLLRSFQALAQVSPGFESSHVLTFHISAGYGETTDQKKLSTWIEGVLSSVAAMPGVRATATSATLPGIANNFQTEFKSVETGSDPTRIVSAESRFVSPKYFSTMRIPLLSGTTCGDALTGGQVIVNRSFANSVFAGAPVVGRHIQSLSNVVPRASEIRGVVADAREDGITHPPVPTVYWCISAPEPDPMYLVRTQGTPMLMAQAIRRKIHEVEPNRSVFDIVPLDEHLHDQYGETRLRTILLTFFAVAALSLACIGLYGTLSYFVSLQRREIGLRLALGALRGQVLQHFLINGIGVALAGCLIGLFLAMGFSRVLSGMLYGISSFDPVTFGGVVFLMLLVAAAASVVPARRAALLEPMQVLRDE
ncbi:MAG: ABC transporter permease [Acidobacteriota bacterium]|nr:ABC transporter permease [Acidobacteriota bacterium]